MAASTEEGWEDGTAVAGAAYSEAIAKSEPDFENESGTAVAGQDYGENIRKSGGDLAGPAKAARAASEAAAAAAVTPLARPGVAQRSPTMAFGTPAMLRAPAAAPAPERRTPAPLPGLRAPGPVSAVPSVIPRAPGPGSAVPSVIPPRESRSAASRKPAPSGFVDQPFGAGDRPPEGPVAQERRPGNISTAAATKERGSVAAVPVAAPLGEERRSGAIAKPIAQERRSGAIAKPIDEERRSGAINKPFVAEERDRRSGRISAQPENREERDGRYSNPPPNANIDAGFDDGAEDESAGDLDAFDHAETMGQPQRQSSPVIAPRAPAPLRPTPAPMRAVQGGFEPSLQPYEASPVSPADPALARASAMVPQQHPQYAPMPTDYRMVSADEMHAFRSPLSSPIIHELAPAPRVAAPKRRVVLISLSAAAVIALAVGAYVIFSGKGEPTTTAAVTTPAAATPVKKDTDVVADDKTAKPAAPTADAKKAEPKGKSAVATAAQPPRSELPAPPKTTTPPKTTVPTATKAATKTIAKTAAKTTATKTVKKVAKKPVRKAPVRRKAPVKPAAKCSGLDCV